MKHHLKKLQTRTLIFLICALVIFLTGIAIIISQLPHPTSPTSPLTLARIADKTTIKKTDQKKPKTACNLANTAYEPKLMAKYQGQNVDYQNYGLPEPTDYAKYLEDLQHPTAKNYALSLLFYEKYMFHLIKNNSPKIATLKKQGDFKIFPYLITAWMWFENGSGTWSGPDLYAHNCQDNIYTPDTYCDGMLQIAGFQYWDRLKVIDDMYKVCYNKQNPIIVMNKAILASRQTSRPEWSYLEEVNKEISPNGLIKTYIKNNEINAAKAKIKTIDDIINLPDDRQRQFYLVLISKTPCMAMLNAYAVSEGDLVGKLRKGDTVYGYIGVTEKAKFANLVEALRRLDKITSPHECKGDQAPANLSK